MIETFTASNGVTVARKNDPAYPLRAGGAPLKTAEFDALRELFQHERDTELGRWRWPENPDFVVYAWTADTPPRRDVRGVTVLSEAIPRGYTVWEDRADAPSYGTSTDEAARRLAREAARAYFVAHPDPKPWHDAKSGEIWAVEVEGVGRFAARVETDAGFPRFIDISDEMSYGPRAGIVAAFRIWPEGDK